MTQSGTPTLVGKHLAERREELDLTQQALASRIGITVNSVSAAENGRTVISRGKRPLWEQALELAPGAINRSYTKGVDLERVEPAEPQPKPYINLADRYERAVWELDLSEEDRRTMIEILRSSREDARRTA
ncbi:helix-turn-helix domain-containing protein [Streptomyces sp. NPDC088124]|uniref:helix-turn-helix transcriptional regulator n=1 Tax=Streptomyces sp. NPDC088124 TaxID=3154654 RepID=UPI00342F1E4A